MIEYRCNECVKNDQNLFKRLGYCYLLFKKNDGPEPNRCPIKGTAIARWKKSNRSILRSSASRTANK